MKRIVMVFLSTLLAIACNLEKIEDGNSSGMCSDPSAFKFTYSFGGGIMDSACAIVRTAPGEYFITGFTKKQGEKMLLYKTNLCKDTLLYLSNGDGTNFHVGNGICASLSDGVVAAGARSGIFGDYGYVQQVSNAGVITDSWVMTLDQGLGFNDIIQSSAGGYILGGYKLVDGQFGDQEQAFIMLMDASLNPVQQITFTTSFGADVKDVIQLGNGEIIGVGSYWIGFGNRILLNKTNGAGAVLLQKGLTFNNIGGDNNVYGDAATPTSDGNLVIAGHYRVLTGQNTIGFLKKVDPEGNLLWEQEYADLATTLVGDHVPAAVIATADGGYLMVGSHKLNTGNSDVFLVKVDANGQFQWDRSYGGAGNDVANDVLQETDGSYVVAGCTKSGLSAGEEGRVYLIKTDKDGKTQ